MNLSQGELWDMRARCNVRVINTPGQQSLEGRGGESMSYHVWDSEIFKNPFVRIKEPHIPAGSAASASWLRLISALAATDTATVRPVGAAARLPLLLPLLMDGAVKSLVLCLAPCSWRRKQVISLQRSWKVRATKAPQSLLLHICLICTFFSFLLTVGNVLRPRGFRLQETRREKSR